VLKRIYRRIDLIDCAVEFFLRICEILSAFPHDQLHDDIAFRNHFLCELLHTCNSISNTHRWPYSTAVIISLHGCVECFHRLLFGTNGITTDTLSYQSILGLDTDRREYLAAFARPSMHSTIA